MGYNGFSNYATWNVALWLNNEPSFYNAARKCRNYSEYLTRYTTCFEDATPDGVQWASPEVNAAEVNAAVWG